MSQRSSRWDRSFRAGQSNLLGKLQRGADLANSTGDLLSRFLPVSPKDLPTYTLLRLEMEARLQFGSALQLLSDPWRSYGVDPHIRMLLEATAHTAWLVGRADAPGNLSGICRAICVELGWLRERRFNTRKVEAVAPDDMDADIRIRGDEEADVIERVRTAKRCRCKGRRADDVKASLEAIKDDEGYPDWYPYLYDLYSQSVHLQAPERFTRSQGEMRIFMGATFLQRSYSLTWLLITYGKIAEWSLEELVGKRRARSIARSVAQVVHSNWLAEARDGVVDVRLGYAPQTFPRSYPSLETGQRDRF